MFSKQTWEAHLALQSQERESKARSAGGPIRVHLRGKPPQILWGDGSTGQGRDFVPGPIAGTAEYVEAVREYWTQRVRLAEQYLKECALAASGIHRPTVPWQAAWGRIPRCTDELEHMRHVGKILAADREKLKEAQAEYSRHPQVQEREAFEAGEVERHNEDMRAKSRRAADANALCGQLLKAD